MYIAELRGKLSSDIECKEDVLTSNVFSFLKYAPRHIFLARFLNLLKIHCPEKDLRGAEFNFWISFDDGTEPDLVIIVGDYYVLIEAKYFSGFGQENGLIAHQLIREYENGLRASAFLNKKFVMATITADFFDKPFYLENIDPTIKRELLWVNWQSITKIIEDVLISEPLSKETLEFANDLFSLLQKKGFRNFIGIERLISNQPLIDVGPEFFFDLKTSNAMDIFQGFSGLYLENMSEAADQGVLFYGKNHSFFDFSSTGLVEIDREIFYGGYSNG